MVPNKSVAVFFIQHFDFIYKVNGITKFRNYSIIYELIRQVMLLKLFSFMFVFMKYNDKFHRTNLTRGNFLKVLSNFTNPY